MDPNKLFRLRELLRKDGNNDAQIEKAIKLTHLLAVQLVKKEAAVHLIDRLEGASINTELDLEIARLEQALFLEDLDEIEKAFDEVEASLSAMFEDWDRTIQG